MPQPRTFPTRGTILGGSIGKFRVPSPSVTSSSRRFSGTGLAQIIPGTVRARQDPPAEAVAGAIRASRDYPSGLMLAVYESVAGWIILNRLLIREDHGANPVAERLLGTLCH